ncbi:MAG: Major Facilitator Superfamily protein [Verrucomicrobiales bacterium]|nr:Major Facilitator Superfamily protein [Verrucomicrobiales bacterium]
MQDRAQLTYRFDNWRAISAGIVESASGTFLLLMAVRWFHANDTAKGLIATGGSVGYLLAPLIVSFVEARGWPTSIAAARLCAIGAISFLISAAIPIIPVFVLCGVIAMATASAIIPLMTQIYQENYGAKERGRRFSRTLMIRIGATVAFTEIGGLVLKEHIGYSRYILFIFGIAMATAAICLKRIPSSPLANSGSTHPLRALRFAKSDRLFRLTLMNWMLMGTGTLMMQPLRIEYVANPKYGQTWDVLTIALLTGVIPNAVRLVLSPFWGWLFDRANFFVLRVVLNIGFMLSIVTFFMSNTFTGLLIGALIYGISNAGGDIAWSLWVTKFAPPPRVAEYMAAHTFFTGCRGVIAPVLSFQLIAANVSMMTLGWISAGLIVGGTLLLVPEIPFGKSARPATALADRTIDSD